jgi:hypothetical protein
LKCEEEDQRFYQKKLKILELNPKVLSNFKKSWNQDPRFLGK